jgi:hypothetical protein
MAKKEKPDAAFAESLRELLGHTGCLLLAMSLDGQEAVLKRLEDIGKAASKAREIGHRDMVGANQSNIKTGRAGAKTGGVV